MDSMQDASNVAAIDVRWNEGTPAQVLGLWAMFLTRWTVQEDVQLEVRCHDRLTPIAVRLEADVAYPEVMKRMMTSLQSFPSDLASLDDMSIEHPLSGSRLCLHLTEAGECRCTLEPLRPMSPSSVVRMARAFEALVASHEADRSRSLSGLSILTEAESDRVIRRFNDTAAPFAHDRLIHELFEAQVERTPDAVALRFGERTLTFAQLDDRANHLARYLRLRGARAGEPIALCMHRSLDGVTGLLGILKAGAAYVPMDPLYPRPRLSQMLEETAASVLLTQRQLLEHLPVSTAVPIAIEDAWETADADLAPGTSARALGVDADDVAFVIFTSGSTGRPKGAANGHRGMSNRILAQADIEGFGTGDVCCQRTSISFVDAVFEIFGALCTGTPLVIAPAEISNDCSALARFVLEQDVTRLTTVPSMARTLLQDASAMQSLRGLRSWTLSGEAVQADLLRRLQHWLPSCVFIVQYGSSEVSSDAAIFRCTGRFGDDSRVPIGRPLPNVRIYILDRHGRPVPVGVPGEIHVAGVGVGLGYWKRPELTAERFRLDPFSRDERDRLYCMGDLGAWREDGQIDYLGRIDHQVKIRGIRVEPAEVEARLSAQPCVREAAVVAREERPGDVRLIAYVRFVEAKASPSSVLQLRAALLRELPEHLLPSAIVRMEQLPRTPNGKLDRRALPAPAVTDYATREYEAPRGETEHLLATLWQELLGIERVGRKDHFFELGGHSLLVVTLRERLRQEGYSARFDELYAHPELAAYASTLRLEIATSEITLSCIVPECKAITPEMVPLAHLSAADLAEVAQQIPGGAAAIEDIYPLAPLQEGILFEHRLNGGDDGAYVLPLIVSISSQDRFQALVAAVQATIDRHDVLRTAVLFERLPHPVQVVLRQATLPVEIVALDPSQDPHAQLLDGIRGAQANLPLQQAPLLRLRAGVQHHRWHALLLIHHIVVDDVSLSLLIDELATLLREQAKVLSPPIPYRRHVEHALLLAQQNRDEAFFRDRLGSFDFPTAPFMAGVASAQAADAVPAQACACIDGARDSELRERARQLGVPPATVFHTAWALVLAQLCARDDVVFGTVLLGRMQSVAGAQQMLGLFINTLPIRIRLGTRSARDLVHHTQRELSALMTHEQASLSLAQRCSGVAADVPLFTTLLNYRYQSGAGGLPAELGFEVRPAPDRTRFPIVISIDDRGTRFDLTSQAQGSVSPERLLAYLTCAVSALIDALGAHPAAESRALSVMPASERAELLETFNPVPAPVPEHRVLTQLIEEQAERTPLFPAVAYEGQALSFAELNARANRLARFLMREGAVPGSLVGVCVERGLDLIVGLLGVLKAGAAYVPLDPGYPSERLKHLVADASPRIILTQSSLRSLFSAAGPILIALEKVSAATQGTSGENLSPAETGLSPHQLAYVIYTSGSTGRPKGVMVEHRAVVNLWQGLEKLYETAPEARRIGLNASVSFDASVQQLVQLASGRTLIVVPTHVRQDAAAMVAYLREHRIEGIDCTPSQLRGWLDAGLLERPGHLRIVLVGGEAIDRALWLRLAHCQRIEFHNVYGPTECTVDATSARLRGDGSMPHIGKPMLNRRAYILDGERRLLPKGVVGELYIGGEGIARGYLNREALTHERFSSDPFSNDRTGRLYRTGDLARWRDEGQLEFFGRNDHQVKIRGHRIELGEIEAQLASHPLVGEVVVSVREDVSGDPRLVAYVTRRHGASSSPAVETLRAFVRKSLPAHMVPSAFVVLDRLPVTPSGKLDSQALPAPDRNAFSSVDYEAPRGDIEQMLAGIYQSLLPVHRVGRHDHFFELGGHSLLATRLTSQIQREFDVELPVRMVFDHPSIAGLGRCIFEAISAELTMEEP